ncbi:MAG: hypothetical protein HOG08_03145, partial [Candidatus Magasanikbacteria bacterium]|nr:hypothetical protein [Candidatus Magasanikbacteria bacterium]
MISLQQIKLPITHLEEELQEKIADILGLTFEQVKDFHITKRAIDSRKKRQMIYFVYSIELSIENELNVLKSKIAKKNTKFHRICMKKPNVYEIPEVNVTKQDKRP